MSIQNLVLDHSITSRQSINPNYHQIAIELVNGAPLDIVSQRDLHNVIIELSILRSEANDIKDYSRSDIIKDIIMGLNKRIKPPTIRYTTTTSPKNSPKGKLGIKFTLSNNIQTDNSNSNSPTRTRITLSNNEYNQISNEVDQMLELMRNNKLDQFLLNFNESDYPKYHFIINERREKCLNEFKYNDLKLLDSLSDKLHQIPYDPKIDIYNEKIEELKVRIEMSSVKISTIKVIKTLKINSLINKKNQELQKLMEKHEKEMKNFDDINNIISQTAINKQSLALKEMRFNEISAALARDYEGAEKIHKNANIKEAEEKDENSRRFDENVHKKKELLEKKQKTEIDCMEQWFDYLITKEKTLLEKEIDTNMAAIKSAEIQISQIQSKIKSASKSLK